MSGGPDATREFASKLDDPQRWVIKQGVPIFKAHERTDPATGQLIKVDLPKLYRIAGNMQKLERQGGVPIRCTLGHTEPNKSEPEQPPVGGYYKNARVQPFGPKGEPAIVVDEWLDPQYAPVRKNFPYRSAEYYDDAEQITGVALLTRDPFLDLGVVAYERGDSLVCYTAQSQPDRRLNYHRNGQRAPVLYHLVIGETAPIQYNAYGQSVGYAAGYYAGGPPNTGEGADDYRQRQEREYAGSRELALSSMLQHFRPGTLGSGTEQQMVRRQPGEIQGGIARRTDNSAYAAYPEGVANYGNWAPQGGYRPGMAGWPRSQEQQAQDAEFDIPPEVIAEQEAQDAEEARWQAAQVGIRQREARDDTNAAGRNLWGHPTGQFGAPPNLRYGNWQGAATGAVRGGFEGARAGAGKGKYGTAIGAATGAVLGGYEGWQKDPKRATPVKQATPVSSSRYGMAGAAVGGLMGGDLGMDIGGDAASGLIGAGLGAGVGHMAQENMKDPFTMPSGNQGAGRTPLSHGVLNARYAAYPEYYAAYPEYYAAYPEYYAAYPEYYAAYPEYYADDHDKVDETFDEDQYSPEDIARMRAEQESHNKNQQRKVSQQEADRKALEGRRNRRKPPPFSTYANQGHQMPPNQYSAPWPGPAYHPHHIGRQHTSAWRFADDQDPAQYGIGGAISGGMTGARLGMMAGPMGAVAGGLGGAAIGGMSGENSTKNARYGAGGSMGSSQYANPLSIGGNIGPIGGSIGIGGGSQNSRYANSGYGRGRPGRYAGEMPGGPPPGGPGSMGPGGSPGGGDPLQQLQMLLMGAVEILGQMTGGGGGGGGGGMGPGGPPPGAGGPPPGPPQGPFPGNEEEQYARYQAARYAQQRRQPGRYAGVGAPVPYGYPAPQRTISGKPVGESMAVSALNYQLQQQGQVIKMLAYERDQADSEACIEAVQRLADQGFPVSEYEVGELKSKSRDQRGAYLNHIATHYQKIGTDNMPQVLGDPTPAGSDPRSGAPTSKDEMEAALKIASASPNDPTAYNKALAQVRYGRDGGMQYGANRIAGYPQGLADASVQAEWTPGNPYGEPSANGHY